MIITYREQQGLINKHLLPYDFYKSLYEVILDLSRDVVEKTQIKTRTTSKQNQDSISLERKLGFQVVSEMEVIYANF